MANVTITQLPAAGPITGTESVPIVQNGQTVQTTTAAIAAAPAQFQTFLTVNQEPTLPNSRYLSTGTGLGMVDGGEQSFYRLDLNGVSGSLETASQGILAKDSSTVYGRVLTASGSGLSITDGNGVNGNPTFQLTGLVQSLANLTGSGMLFLNAGSSVGSRQIVGTTNQVNVVNTTGVDGNPTVSLSDNPVVPGTYGITVPSGTTGERGGGANGQIRYNTTLSRFEGFQGGSWRTVGLGDGTVTSISMSGGTTGMTVSGGPITSSGTFILEGNPTLAENLVGGGANQIAYQSAENTTAFVDAPTSSDTFLKWDGSSLVWGALPGGGTVTSVGLALPTNDFEISNSPVTSSGTLTGAWKSQLAKTFLAAPNADAGTPSFREIVASDIPTLNQNTTGTADNVTGVVAVANGGTGQTTAQAAINSLAGAVTSGYYLRGNGTNVVMAAIQAADVPTLNQNTTGTASNVTDTVAVANGGTGQTTRQDAMDALAGAVTAGYYLRGDGNDVVMSAIQAADVPTLNQNTTGQAGSVANSVTFDASGTGGASPQTFNGSAAVTISRNTLGAAASGANADITSMSAVTGSIGSPTYIQMGSGSGTVLAAGRMWYDQTTGSLNFGMGGGNITQQVGEEIFVYGKASATITEGQVIAKTGTVGASGVVTFAPAPLATTSPDLIIGVATENIASGSFGRVTRFGVVHGIDTSMFVDGDSLYYDPAVVGGWTKTKPSAPNLKLEVATVINAGAGGSGSVFVALGTSSTLGGTDSNVQFGSLNNGDIIFYDSTAQYWKNAAQSTLAAGSATNATNTAITANTTNADYYITVVSTNTGNLPQLVASGLTANPSTGKITGGISGGTF